MPIPSYNEGAGIEWTATFTDERYQPAVPGTVHWRLTCEHCDKVLKDWTQVAASLNADGTVTAYIEVPGSVVTLCDRRNQREPKKLLVVSDKDTAREYSEDEDGRFFVKRTGRNTT